MDTIRFAVEYSPKYKLESVMVYINGRNFLDIVREVERPFAIQEGHANMAGGYVGLPLNVVLFPSEHLLGQPLHLYADTSTGKIEVLQCGCGEPGCWPLMARVEVGADVVVWSDFEQPHRTPNKGPMQWKYDGLGPFYFERRQYEQALLNLWEAEIQMSPNIPDLDKLPFLPQLEALTELAPRLWARSEVAALWIGGSIARGNADAYSDVDLRIAVLPGALEAWRHVDLNALCAERCVAHVLLPVGEGALLHHLVLDSGDIYDVWVQSTDEDVHDASLLTLACRDEVFAEKLRSPKAEKEILLPSVEGEAVRQLLEHFWINTHKHRKVLHRGLHLLAQIGIHHERQLLLRLWYMQATGNDCGEARTQTIHGLTEIMRTVEQARGSEALAILGASLASGEEICKAIEQLREQVAQTGRILAQTLGFHYPEALEHVAQREWRAFMEQSA